MAKAPAAKVAASSGQGVSRLAYQKAYALGKGASVPGDKAPRASLSMASSHNDYAKTKLSKAPQAQIDVPDTEQGKPPKPSVSLKQAASKKLEFPKEDSGFLKVKK